MDNFAKEYLRFQNTGITLCLISVFCIHIPRKAFFPPVNSKANLFRVDPDGLHVIVKFYSMFYLINVCMDNKKCHAHVTEFKNHFQHIYRVRFEDGYENNFYTDVETGQWIEEDLGYTMLATETGKQIKLFMSHPIHVPKLLTWHKQRFQNKTLHFGFYSHIHNNEVMYQIYGANKRFLYSLAEMENNEWHILNLPENRLLKVDTKLANMIIQVLPLIDVEY